MSPLIPQVQTRAPWWAWLLYSLASISLTLLVVMGGMLALALLGVDFTDYVYLKYPPVILSGLVGGSLALIVAGPKVTGALLMRFFQPTRELSWGGLRPPASWPLLWRRVGLGVIFLAGVQVVWASLGWRAPESLRVLEHIVWAVRWGGMFWPAFWLVLAVGIVTPIGEEMVYRGLGYGFLRRKYGFWVAAVLSSVLFGLPHLHSAVPAGLMGLYFAYQVEEDRSLWGAIILHMINNLAALLLIAYR